MRVALLEPFAGVAGDMFVGACLHAGASLKGLREALAGLPLEGFSVSARKVVRCGVTARKFTVRHKEHHPHRTWRTIRALLKKAKLAKAVRDRATEAFRLLAEAEARVHGVPVDSIHFHEVGAVDAVCDIVGAAFCIEDLGVEALHTRPLPLSTGFVEAAHGRIPVPAPATMELLQGLPVVDSGLKGELVTPTGAALVKAWASPAPAPPFTADALGYGAGDRDPEGYPNVCRLVVGETTGASGGLSELVCDVDDATPQVLGHLLARLLEAGARDATLQAVSMKKDRPGTRVTALARAETVPALEAVLFREGTTLGVRRRAVERTELPRRIVRVKTDYGAVRVKVGTLGGEVVHVAPEYEDCRARAAEAGVPLREVLAAAVRKWRR